MKEKSFLLLLFLSILTLSIHCLGISRQAHSRNHYQNHTLFQLRGVNYEKRKILHYDVLLNPGDCSIIKKDPFDIYYIRPPKSYKREQKIIKTHSKRFKARNITFISEHELKFTFKAFADSEHLGDRPPSLHVKSTPKNQECEAIAWFRHNKENYSLTQVYIFFKKFLGIAVGVDWVKLLSMSTKKSKNKSFCLHGKCPQ